MKPTITYTNEPLQARVMRDFLPKPEELVLKEKKTKVTLALSQKSVDFFKSVAKKQHAPYQGMIRQLLDYYVVNQNSL